VGAGVCETVGAGVGAGEGGTGSTYELLPGGSKDTRHT
jgi:hypothetical protein